MDSLAEESTSNTNEMQQYDKNENSRLVGPPTGPKTNYVNMINNICGATLLCIIIFCCFKDGVTLFSFHPILMTLGWLMFMATAINAIAPGDLATEWMPIRLRSARHWVLQLCGSTIIFIGLIVIVTNKFIHDKPHFASLHSKFGLSAIIFMFITMTGGLGALYSMKLKNYLPPLYTKLIHAFFGVVTFSLGIIAIILAYFSTWWTFGDILRYMNLVLALIILLFTVLRPSLKIYFRLKERFESPN